MSKAYEVSRCWDCPGFAKLFGFPSYCNKDADKRLVEGPEYPPDWCSLPDMPISKMETTTEVKA